MRWYSITTPITTKVLKKSQRLDAFATFCTRANKQKREV